MTCETMTFRGNDDWPLQSWKLESSLAIIILRAAATAFNEV